MDLPSLDNYYLMVSENMWAFVSGFFQCLQNTPVGFHDPPLYFSLLLATIPHHTFEVLDTSPSNTGCLSFWVSLKGGLALFKLKKTLHQHVTAVFLSTEGHKLASLGMLWRAFSSTEAPMHRQPTSIFSPLLAGREILTSTSEPTLF